MDIQTPATSSVIWRNCQGSSRQLPSLHHDISTAAWTPKQPRSIPTTPIPSNRHIKVLSFNIRKEKDFLEKRMDALLALLMVEQPDVICLQENTLAHEKKLLSSGFLRERYFMSSLEGQGPGFKVSLLSTFPLFLVLASLQGRPCVLGETRIEGGKSLCFASVHLTSGNNAGIRRMQLFELYEIVRGCDIVVIAGDCNMKGELEDRVCNAQGFTDCWVKVAKNKNDPEGVTRISEKGKFRLDRCLIRGRISCEGFRVVGKEVIPGTNGLSISDHYGIVASLQMTQGEMG